MSPKLVLWWLVFILAFGLIGCRGVIQRPEQPVQENLLSLRQSLTLGQSFTTHYAGLAGVSVYMKPVESDRGTIIFHLRQSSQETTDLRTASLDLASIKKRGYYSFPFEPVSDPAFSSYYLLLEMEGQGEALVGAAGGESYLDGALYQGGIAQDAQLHFGLQYSSIPLIAGFMAEVLSWIYWIAAGIFLFLIPGWALMSWLWPKWGNLNWGEKIGLGFGTGLALTPLLFLLSSLFKISPGKLLALLPGIFGAAYLAWKFWGIQRKSSTYDRVNYAPRLSAPQIIAQALPQAVLAIVVLLIIFTRFWAIRTIDVPMWGDSVQHTVIAQLLLDHNGLFNSWEPYTPYSTLSVHFGFPAHTALFAWLTGLPTYRAALITAQLVNALAVICLLPLAYRLSKGSHWAAAGTLIAAGLISTMPAFYVNWGRFAQLDGQAILAVGIWLGWDILKRMRDRSIPPVDSVQFDEKTVEHMPGVSVTLKAFLLPCLIAGAVFAGMTLTYYRMPFYAITFFLGLLIAWLANRELRTAVQRKSILLAGIMISAAMFLFLLPWLPRLSGSALSDMVVQGVTTAPVAQRLLVDLSQWKNLAAYLSPALIILSIVAFFWSLLQKRWEIAAFGLWILLLQLFQAGRLVNLPGANMLQVFAIIIWLYFPIGLLIGCLCGEISAWVQKRKTLAGQILLAAVFLLAALIGANNARLVAQPAGYSMVTRPDLRAMSWIRTQTEPQAIFLVEGSRINLGRSVVGTDAGWWIPLFTLRKNTMPPQYAILNEVPSEEGQSKQYIDLVAALEAAPMSDPGLITMLCKAGITHVYIGQRRGSVGSGTQQLFTPTAMIDTPGYIEVYHEDRVYIFALDPAACER